MKKNYLRKIKDAIVNNRGEGYIDTALTVFIVALLLGVIINVFSLLVVRQNIDMFAEELIDVMTASGRTGTEVNERIVELNQETGLNPTIDFDGTVYISGSQNVQLGKDMKVTVTVSANIKGLGVFTMPVTLKSVRTGLSKVYWK